MVIKQPRRKKVINKPIAPKAEKEARITEEVNKTDIIIEKDTEEENILSKYFEDNE